MTKSEAYLAIGSGSPPSFAAALRIVVVNVVRGHRRGGAGLQPEVIDLAASMRRGAASRCGRRQRLASVVQNTSRKNNKFQAGAVSRKRIEPLRERPQRVGSRDPLTRLRAGAAPSLKLWSVSDLRWAQALSRLAGPPSLPQWGEGRFVFVALRVSLS